VAAAERLVAGLWPAGAMQQALNFVPMTEVVLGMRVREFGIPLPMAEGASPDATLAQLIGAGDPHFMERMRISSRVAGEEMARAGTLAEPEFRRILAQLYARSFSQAELEEAGRFYNSPAGRSLSVHSMNMIQDRVLIRDMLNIIPRVAAQVPAIVQRVTAATAHLPAPPPPPPEVEPAPEAGAEAPAAEADR
jgi:hypothetical protein